MKPPDAQAMAFRKTLRVSELVFKNRRSFQTDAIPTPANLD